MACLSEDAGKDVRAAIYRLLRYLIVDQHDVNELRVRYIELFLIRSVRYSLLPNLRLKYLMQIALEGPQIRERKGASAATYSLPPLASRRRTTGRCGDYSSCRRYRRKSR